MHAMISSREGFDATTWSSYVEMMDEELAQLTEGDPRHTFLSWAWERLTTKLLRPQILFT